MMTLLLVMTLQAIQPTDQELGKDWLIDRVARDIKVQPGTPIEVHNPYGDIRSRGTDDGILAISAMVQSKKGDDHKIEFDIVESSEGIVVNVIYKGREEDTIKKNGQRRADVTVYVPGGSPFTVSTFKGYLEAKGLKSDVDAYSERGKIFLRTNGHIKAKTRQGDIKAVVKEAVWKRPLAFESVLGVIEVQVPSHAGGMAIAKTGGHITSDYSIEIKHAKGSKMKTGRARLGEGNQEIHLTNHQGDIKIIRGLWDEN